jgi:hypothetical protein
MVEAPAQSKQAYPAIDKPQQWIGYKRGVLASCIWSTNSAILPIQSACLKPQEFQASGYKPGCQVESDSVHAYYS